MGVRPVGRPRDEITRRAVLDAVVALVEEHGLNAVTMQAIARRAGTSKPTVYRWWPDKAAVLMDAFVEEAERMVDLPPAGGLTAELTAQMKALTGFFERTRMGRTITALIAEAQSDPQLAAAIRERWLAPRRAAAAAAFARAREHGEIHDDVPDDVLIDTLYGPLYFRLMVGHAPVDDALVETIVRTVLGGATPTP